MSRLSFAVLAVLAVLAVVDSAAARNRWLERDGHFVALYPRRFGQEHPAVIDKLAQACPSAVCGTLAGQAITPLLGAQGECTQQDFADGIIDAALQFDATTQANMIAIAQEYRQAEKNTPPDFTTNPPTNRNSVFCQKAPRNAQLNGLVQAQDPANDPDIFFDPATGASVTKGSQPNTFPFSTSDFPAGGSATVSSFSAISSPTAVALVADTTSATDNPCLVTVTVQAPLASQTASDAVLVASPTSGVGDFGSCSVPQIEFGVGFDGRTETSFEPVDKASYNHGSAQAIDIIAKFICDTLSNSCGADQTAKDTCTKAQAAADAQPPKTGAQADAFNAIFGIDTDFAAIPAIDDHGDVVAGSSTDGDDTTPSATTSAAAATSTADASSETEAPVVSSGIVDDSEQTAAATSGSSTASTADASEATATAAAASSTAVPTDSSIGDFGSCSVPQIEFGTGFDGRKETSFEPVDQVSYNHGSAQAIDIITQFICNSLTNTCGADQTAKDTCAKAQTAADGQPPKTGAQADAFNAVFGIETHFADIAPVDDQGRTISA